MLNYTMQILANDVVVYQEVIQRLFTSMHIVHYELRFNHICMNREKETWIALCRLLVYITFLEYSGTKRHARWRSKNTFLPN